MDNITDLQKENIKAQGVQKQAIGSIYYGASPTTNYSNRELIKEHYNGFEKFWNTTKLLGKQIQYESYSGIQSYIHYDAATENKRKNEYINNWYWKDHPYEKSDDEEVRNQGLALKNEVYDNYQADLKLSNQAIENDFKAMQNLISSNEQELRNEAWSAQWANTLILGAARLGVGASTAGIYAVLGVIGNQYTTAINEGKSPDTAMFHAGASGGISGGIEIVGGGLIEQALKKPLAVLGKHVSKLAAKMVTGFLKEGGEEFFQGISQIILDFVTYGGKPPGSHDEEGNAQWGEYWKQQSLDLGLSVIIGGTIGMGGGAIEYKSGLNLDRTVTKSVNATMEVYKKTKNFYTKTPSEIADIETKLEEGFTNMYMRKETERSLYTRDFVEQLPTKELIPSAIAVQKTTNKNAKSLTALFDKGNDLDIQYKKGLSEITSTQEKLAELQAQHNEIDNESNKQQEVFKKEQAKIEKKIKKLETKNENNRVKRDLERAKIEGSKKTLINNISNQALRRELNNLDITTPKGRLAFISKIKQAIKNGKVKNTKKTLTQAEALVKQSKTINDRATSESNIYKADNRRAREEQGKVNAKSRALANEVEGAKDVLYEEGALVEGAYLEGKNQLSIMAKNMDTIAQDIKNYSKGFNSRTKKKRNTFITQVKTLVGKKQYDANWINNMKKGNQETLTMETMALDLDGNSVNTPFHDRFVKDVQNCRIAQEGMLTKSGQIMQDILGAWGGKRYVLKLFEKSNVSFADEGGKITTKKYTTTDRILTYMYSLNSFSKDILVRNHKVTDSEIAAIKSTLTAKDMTMIDSLFKEFSRDAQTISDIKEGLTGKKFDMLEYYIPEYFMKEINTIAPEMVSLVGVADSKTDSKTTGVNQGRTISRRMGGRRKLNTNLVNILTRFNRERSHYIAFAEYIKENNSFLSNNEIQSEIIDKFGEETYDYLLDFDKRLATDNMNTVNNWLEKQIRGMRAKATSTVLGYKIVTAMKGLASYLGATAYVNPSKLVQGTMDYAAHPKVWGETIKRLDPKTYNKGFNIALDYIMSTSGTKSMRSVSMILCATADNITSRSVWVGAFQDYMSKNPGATEIQAAKHAGQIVSTTQPSTYVEDLPPIYDNELYRLIAPFTNQRIKYWNMTQQFINDARSGKISNFEAMSRFTRGIIMPSVMIALIESGFQAIWDQDDEDRYKTLTSETGLNLVSIIPVIGGMISSSLRGFDSAPLGLQPIIKGTQAIMAIKKGIEDDDMEDSFEPIAEAISYAFGAPSDFGINLVENLKIMNEENEYNMAGFIYSDYAYKKYFKD